MKPFRQRSLILGLFFFLILIANMAPVAWGQEQDTVIRNKCQIGCAELQRQSQIPVPGLYCEAACFEAVKEAMVATSDIAGEVCPAGAVQIFTDAPGLTCAWPQKLYGTCPAGQVPIQPPGSPLPVCMRLAF